MFNVKSLLASSAIVGLLAAPAMALSLDTSADLSVDSTVSATGIDAGVGASTKVATSVETNGSKKVGAGVEGSAAVGATSETGMAKGVTNAIEKQSTFAAAADSAFMGNIVLSSDGEEIGTVNSVMVDADGNVKILVDIDSALETKAKRFSLNIGSTSEADGEIKLGWTKAELMTSFDAQVSAAANG